jgi:multiple sugar transport system permease protein
MTQQSATVPIPSAQELVSGRHRLPRRFNLESLGAMSFLFLFVLYFLVPFFWLVVSSTKTAGDLFGTFGLWFAPTFNLGSNLAQLFSYNNGIYVRWLLNTLLYAEVGALLGTFLAAMAGYALAKYVFRGRHLIFSLVLGAILVPGTALALPLYLLMSKVNLTNTYWAVLLPSIVSPFGVYLSRIYAALLFQFVAIWNNYFLPLVMLSDQKLFPITVGLQTWNVTTGGANKFLYTLIISGALVSSIPLLAGCVLLQRFWRGGLGAGSVKG